VWFASKGNWSAIFEENSVFAAVSMADHAKLLGQPLARRTCSKLLSSSASLGLGSAKHSPADPSRQGTEPRLDSGITLPSTKIGLAAESRRINVAGSDAMIKLL